MRAIVSWLKWTRSERGFSSCAVNCVRVVPWSLNTSNATHYTRICEPDLTKWKTKRSANHYCIVTFKVIVANLVPNWSVEFFSSSPNHGGVCFIMWVGQSVVSPNSVIWCSWASDNNVFIMITIADRSIWALIKACFISRARNIVHQNWFIDSIREINASVIWQVSNTCPANSSESWIERSAENIGGSLVKIWIIANGSPVGSIIKLSSSLPGALSNILVVIHSKSSKSILRNQRWILGLEICFKTWLIYKKSLSICTGEWCCQKGKYFLHFYKILNLIIN